MPIEWLLDFRLRILLYSSSKRGNLQNHRLSRQGFTLVELSIVLVVVGLLIGGVLIGQSLIESAKINAQVKQLAQYDIATRNFIQKYRFLPGESFYFNLTPKNNSVYIRRDKKLLGPSNQSGMYQTEGYFFFPDLYQAKMVPIAFAYNTVRGVGEGYMYPAPAFFGKSGEIHTNPWSTGLTILGVVGNSQGDLFWTIDGTPAGAYTNPYSHPAAAPFFPVQAAALDQKLDDGKPLTGTVMPFSAPGWSFPTISTINPDFPIQTQDGATNVLCAKSDNSYAVNSQDIMNNHAGLYRSSPICGLIIKAESIR